MTNSQAIGYMLVACKNLKIDKKTASKLESEMNYLFDMLTEEEAEELGDKWLYKVEME